MMRKVISVMLSLIITMGFTSTTKESVDRADEATPEYIFFFIGDGMGFNHLTFLEEYLRWKNNEDLDFMLDVHQMPVFTALSTRGLAPLIPDSGAAGTMLATGEVVKNGVISRGDDGTHYISVLKALQDGGMRTGLVTDVAITHATPATFGANVASRDDQLEVAEHYFANRINFLAGGGQRYFLPKELEGKREAGDNLLEKFADADYLVQTDLEHFLDVDFSGVDYYLGLFANKHMPGVLAQRDHQMTPTLAQLTQAGIDVLSKGEDGFFFMVEGGYIDMLSHDNDTIATLHQLLAFYEAIQVAMDFYNQNPDNTLIIMAADHETGGLSLGYNSSNINFEAIEAMSVKFKYDGEPFIFNEDWNELFIMIEEHWSVKLSDEDKESIIYRYENFDFAALAEELGIPEEQLYQSEGMSHMLDIIGHVVAPVLFGETHVPWSSQKHTGAKVPLAVMGIGHENFNSARHLTDVPRILADIMGVEIGCPE